MACKRCGRCCLYTKITLPNTEDGIDGSKWIQLHGCEIKHSKNELAVIVPAICDHLYFDPKEGFACGIYNDRPKICRNYLCDKAKKESNMKPTLEELRKGVTDEVAALQKRFDTLFKERQKIDQEMSAIQARGKVLAGELQGYKKIEEAEGTKEEKPSKKNDKK